MTAVASFVGSTDGGDRSSPQNTFLEGKAAMDKQHRRYVAVLLPQQNGFALKHSKVSERKLQDEFPHFLTDSSKHC